MGILRIVGFGPGDVDNMTNRCVRCLMEADVIVGYSGYVELLEPFFAQKEFIKTGMTREIERCRHAIALAREGKDVCLVSSGDSGVYGMAGLVFELAGEGLKIEVVPGVTAAVSGAALLGAPIANDFAAISLSDILTPWETVEKRLRAAAAGDFAVCMYNPGSKRRTDQLRRACEILLETIPPSRLCGVVSRIGRAGQSVALLTLGGLLSAKPDMAQTIFVGNSQTRNILGRMVTPRGYRDG